MVLNNEIYELYHKNVVKFPTPYWRDISKQIPLLYSMRKRIVVSDPLLGMCFLTKKKKQQKNKNIKK